MSLQLNQDRQWTYEDYLEIPEDGRRYDHPEWV
jgi:hypothetical protein